MKKMLEEGEAIDVSAFPREGDYYVVDTFIDGVDYCNAVTEQWIWSIARRRDGKIFASHKTDLSVKKGFSCIWLR